MEDGECEWDGGRTLTVKANILVTCANRKGVPTAPDLMLRALSGEDVEARAQAWVRLLARSAAPTCPARDLYCGDHWRVVCSLESAGQASGVAVEVWVCSAGYGLVPISATLRSYAATFSAGHPDSVVVSHKQLKAKEIRARWWLTVARWTGPAGPVRTVADLARRDPETPLLVAASPPYLDAMADDLSQAVTVLGESRLAIFCGGDWRLPALAVCLVPCDARLQARLGGARTSLNVRSLRHALSVARGDASRLTAPKLSEAFATLLRASDAPRRAGRAALSDEQVLAYVREALDAEPDLSATALLERLRRSGRACEQARFGRLFRQSGEVARG